MDIIETFLLTKEIRKLAEDLRRLSREIAYTGKRPYPQASWQESHAQGEELLIPLLDGLKVNAGYLLEPIEKMREDFPTHELARGRATSLAEETRAFIHLCIALRERISHSLPEAPLDAPYGASAPKVPPPSVSALMVAEAATRLANEVTSWLLWQANVACRRGL